MTKRKKIFLIILMAMVLGLFFCYSFAYVIRERSIVNLPEYYKEAARRECGIINVLLPARGCLSSVRTAARNRDIIPDNGKCPEGYIALGVACGPGCVDICYSGQ